ncbi:hypothetical protein PBAL39_05996 [Pedobacter sp. BAL39]|uniref:alpha-L-rhamnosidase-related protein n=1 Tax=Pedobacter sp. BAL39 TaxID=391596 RepID=UPI000155AB5D|nr:hypothetical protein [Pedobacter sp. BAL39]EDM33916.1 hypothetical protein PBAL39_05996 [Pedobacter sp. BAL39]
MIKRAIILFAFLGCFFQSSQAAHEQSGELIRHNAADKTIVIAAADQKLSLLIDYANGCRIRQLTVNGKNTLSDLGVYTGFRTGQLNFSSGSQAGASPAIRDNEIKVKATKDRVLLTGIRYGDGPLQVTETWDFKLKGNKVIWEIQRDQSQVATLEDMALPKWNFANLSVWKGGIMDNGGMVWCKYLKEMNDTYGVHTGGVTFWNADSGDALRIVGVPAAGYELASKYAHGPGGTFSFTQMATTKPLEQRYNLSRFVSQREDVFAPFEVPQGKVSVGLELQYVDYAKEYSRGILPGIDAVAVRELLNTTGRYGVVDRNIIGANGWLTNWKCLHEPFFAQIGMALNDDNYTRNFSSTLDQERDQAMLPDGRVLSRWHNAAGDEIPGTYNSKTGYYEAMWGYTVDSQTGYVINASEQFELNGDLNWLRGHQQSCERALDWLIRRDANNNGIFEMMNNGIADAKASDWLDIVWASYENAFVNAQMYEALTLWSNCERILGSQERAAHYAAVAQKLKDAFNKPLDQGGFWSPVKQQYVYWRDQDGSVHGDNLVTPLNFAAIAFGICDDKQRIAQILDQVETRMKKENLFHWPLCFDSFKREEVQGGNWPFPKYENGDIFPTWGYLGVRAYVKHDKSIALKYINKLLEQYHRDGLSSQRYSRTTQLGLGDDILAGICTSITALYSDIYGVRPKWNRLGLEPQMMQKLNGAKFAYHHLGCDYQLELSASDYLMKTDGFSIRSKIAFGAGKQGDVLTCYRQNQDDQTMKIHTFSKKPIFIEFDKWDDKECSWNIRGIGKQEIELTGLLPYKSYQVQIDQKNQKLKSDAKGNIKLSLNLTTDVRFVVAVI